MVFLMAIVKRFEETAVKTSGGGATWDDTSGP